MFLPMPAATPKIGAGAWIKGLFHVEQFREGGFTAEHPRRPVKWKIM